MEKIELLGPQKKFDFNLQLDVFNHDSKLQL